MKVWVVTCHETGSGELCSEKVKVIYVGSDQEESYRIAQLHEAQRKSKQHTHYFQTNVDKLELDHPTEHV